MTMTTVGQLKAYLADKPDSQLVVLARDEEGNSFHLLSQPDEAQMVVNGTPQQVIQLWPGWHEVDSVDEEDQPDWTPMDDGHGSLGV